MFLKRIHIDKIGSRNLVLLGLLISLLQNYPTRAQTIPELYEQGVACRKERNYQTGFGIFSKLLKTDTTNINYMIHGSYFYSKHGFFSPEDDIQVAYYGRARQLALRAIEANSQNADAHYVLALALGHISTTIDIKGKITNARLIKSEAETAIRFDNKHAGAYHLLGRWHMVVAGFNAIEKVALNCLSNGIANSASYEKAVVCFSKAIAIEPSYKMHMVALAETYFEMELYGNAKLWIDKSNQMSSKNNEDKLAEGKAVELLKKLKTKKLIL